MQSFRLPQTLLGRVLGVVLALVLCVAAFFFLFFVLLAVAIALLVWWLRTWLRPHREKPLAPPDVIEGEYSVEIEETRRVEGPPGAGPQ